MGLFFNALQVSDSCCRTVWSHCSLTTRPENLVFYFQRVQKEICDIKRFNELHWSMLKIARLRTVKKTVFNALNAVSCLGISATFTHVVNQNMTFQKFRTIRISFVTSSCDKINNL